MSTEKTKRAARIPRLPKIWEALISFGVLIAVMAIGISVFEADPHIPMLIGTAFAACMALYLGHSWKFVENAMYDGIRKVLQPILILTIIGILIGVWIAAGVVPSMIYYGLMIINPSFFLVTALIICSITSLMTGTSWGTAGTIGLALMGVAYGLGIPLPLAAGAVISGAYFGDKLSPLSDTTLMACGMAGTDVFTHIKYMVKTTIPAYLIAMILYIVIGLSFQGEIGGDVVLIMNGLQEFFWINPVLLLPPLVVVVCIALKMPAIPGIFMGVVSGAIVGAIFQGNSFGDILIVSMDGFAIEAGEQLNRLLNRGGMMGKMYSISLTILAMTFGGIMEKTSQLQVIVEKLMRLAKRTTSLVTLTISTSFASNIVMPEQYISLMVPGRMYHDTYRKRGLHPKMLANALDNGGTMTSALVPWNTCGVYMASTLGVATFAYAPYAFFNLLSPIAVIVMTAFVRRLTVKVEDERETVTDLEGEV